MTMFFLSSCEIFTIYFSVFLIGALELQANQISYLFIYIFKNNVLFLRKHDYNQVNANAPGVQSDCTSVNTRV